MVFDGKMRNFANRSSLENCISQDDAFVTSPSNSSPSENLTRSRGDWDIAFDDEFEELRNTNGKTRSQAMIEIKEIVLNLSDCKNP